MGSFLYHDLSLNPGPVLRGFAAMIGRAKDELVTPADYAAYVDGRREAFEAEFGSWESAVEAIRARRAGNELAPIREVRSEIRHSIEAGQARADRVARRGPPASARRLAGTTSRPNSRKRPPRSRRRTCATPRRSRFSASPRRRRYTRYTSGHSTSAAWSISASSNSARSSS